MNYTKLRIQEAFESLQDRVKNINVRQGFLEHILPTGTEFTDAVGTVTVAGDDCTKDKLSADNATCAAWRVFRANEKVKPDKSYYLDIPFSPDSGMVIHGANYIDLSKITNLYCRRRIVTGPVFTLLCPETIDKARNSSPASIQILNDDTGATYSIRLLQFPKRMYYYNVAMISVSGKVELNHVIVPYGIQLRNIYLQYLIVGEDCMRELSESIPDMSPSPYTWQIKIGATNLVNISEETINLFETKGWTLA